MNSPNRHRHSSDGVGPRSNPFEPHLQRNFKRQADSLSLILRLQSAPKVSARCDLAERCSAVGFPKATYSAETSRPLSLRRILTSFGPTTSQFEFSIPSNHSTTLGRLAVFAPGARLAFELDGCSASTKLQFQKGLLAHWKRFLPRVGSDSFLAHEPE